MQYIKTLWRKIRNIFVPEIMVGVREKREPVNRKERRAVASIARKQTKRNRSKKS